jgi:hypothetical protein
MPNVAARDVWLTLGARRSVGEGAAAVERAVKSGGERVIERDQ